MKGKTVVTVQKTFYLPGVRPYLETFGEYVVAGRVYGESFYFDGRKNGNARLVGKGCTCLTASGLAREGNGVPCQRSISDALGSLEGKGIIYRDRGSGLTYAALPDFALRAALQRGGYGKDRIDDISGGLLQRRHASRPQGAEPGALVLQPLKTLYVWELRPFLLTFGEYVVAGRVYGESFYINGRKSGKRQFAGCGYSTLTAARLAGEGKGAPHRNTIGAALKSLEERGVIYRPPGRGRIYTALPGFLLVEALQKDGHSKDDAGRIDKEMLKRREMFVSDFYSRQ